MSTSGIAQEPKTVGSYKAANYTKSSRGNMSRDSNARSKPLIKATTKVSKKGKADEGRDIIEEIMAAKKQKDSLLKKKDSVQSSKPNILINSRKSVRDDDSDDEKANKSMHSESEKSVRSKPYKAAAAKGKDLDSDSEDEKAVAKTKQKL